MVEAGGEVYVCSKEGGSCEVSMRVDRLRRACEKVHHDVCFGEQVELAGVFAKGRHQKGFQCIYYW